MIFAKTIDKVLNGTKTQTRRVIDPLDEYYGEERDYPAGVFSWRVKDSQPARAKYIVGKTYAVQRGRGIKAEARIRITGIRREDVREIHPNDVKAEGFETAEEYIIVWMKMHDIAGLGWLEALNIAWHGGLPTTPSIEVFWNAICRRPAERYQAWVIEFELDDADAT